MMQGTWRIYSGLMWHAILLPQTNDKRNAQSQPRPPLQKRIIDLCGDYPVFSQLVHR